jgi:hypothetical protein
MAPPPTFALTGCQDAVWYAFRFQTNTSSAPSLLKDGKAGITVTRTSAGLYTVQLPKPYPAQMIACVTGLAVATAGTADQQARYVRASYSATAGTFQIMLLLDDGTPAIGEAGVAADEVDCVAVLNRRAIMNQTT